jgi:hypothetical protein
MLALVIKNATASLKRQNCQPPYTAALLTEVAASMLNNKYTK